jgi:hypothetical protein
MRTVEEIKEYQRRWRENNRVKMREYAKTYRKKHRDVPAHLMRKYGITPEDKIRMWNEQNGLCGVCGETMLSVFDRNCQVEHDHKTKRCVV